MKTVRHLALAAAAGALLLTGCSTGSTDSGAKSASTSTKAEALVLSQIAFWCGARPAGGPRGAVSHGGYYWHRKTRRRLAD